MATEVVVELFDRGLGFRYENKASSGFSQPPLAIIVLAGVWAQVSESTYLLTHDGPEPRGSSIVEFVPAKNNSLMVNVKQSDDQAVPTAYFIVPRKQVPAVRVHIAAIRVAMQMHVVAERDGEAEDPRNTTLSAGGRRRRRGSSSVRRSRRGKSRSRQRRR
jgi:hypothetical protein